MLNTEKKARGLFCSSGCSLKLEWDSSTIPTGINRLICITCMQYVEKTCVICRHLLVGNTVMVRAYICFPSKSSVTLNEKWKNALRCARHMHVFVVLYWFNCNMQIGKNIF